MTTVWRGQKYQDAGRVPRIPDAPLDSSGAGPVHVRFVCFHLRRFITLSQPKPLSASPGKGTLQSVLVLCSRCCNLYGISYSSIDHHITDPLFATSSTIGRDMVKAGQAARAGARPWVTAFESRGLKPGQARAKPFQWLWLGPRVEKAKAPSGQAKAGASRPSRAGTALSGSGGRGEQLE